jgi:hypothetical protein
MHNIHIQKKLKEKHDFYEQKDKNVVIAVACRLECGSFFEVFG